MQINIRPYGVVVRINGDGSVAAHVERIEEVVRDDGTIYLAREFPPEPLDLADPEQFGPLVAALNTALLAENSALKAQIAALTATQ